MHEPPADEHSQRGTRLRPLALSPFPFFSALSARRLVGSYDKVTPHNLLFFLLLLALLFFSALFNVAGSGGRETLNTTKFAVPMMKRELGIGTNWIRTRTLWLHLSAHSTLRLFSSLLARKTKSLIDQTGWLDGRRNQSSALLSRLGSLCVLVHLQPKA